MRYLPVLFLGFTTSVFAQSGLNNIPSADTTPQGTWVPQVSTTIGHERDEDLKLGLKTGINLGPAKAEVGFSSRVYPGKGGPVRLHSKIAMPLGEHWPVIALGVYNVTTEQQYRERVGDDFFYVVLSHDVHWFRLHAGCGLQSGEALPFFGIEKTFYRKSEKAPLDGKASYKAPVEIETHEVCSVRFDVMEDTSGDWVWAAGTLFPIRDFVNFESWANFPTSGAEPSLVLKFNFYVKF